MEGTRTWGTRLNDLLRRSFRNKSSKDVAFPHPQSREDHYWKEEKPSCGGVVWEFFKRTIEVTEYRNGKDEVNPAKIVRLVASFIMTLRSMIDGTASLALHQAAGK